jgi:hypothetical protein
MLSNRDPEVLRRFILDARTPEEQTERQIELFQCASVTLSCIPPGHQFDLLQYAHALEGVDRRIADGGGESFKYSGVANCGVFALPVLVKFASPKNIFSRLPLDHPIQGHFARAIEQSLAMCSATPLAFARVESMIAVSDLNGITPLQVQSSVSNESRRLSGTFQATEVAIPESMKTVKFDAYRKHQGGWSMKLPQVDEVWKFTGPNHPVAYLIIGYFGWDSYLPRPVFLDHSPVGRHRLRSLIEGYLVQDKCSSKGELGCNVAPDRVQVEVGKLKWIHESLTAAQVMQFKAMEQRAGRTQSRFDLTLERRASILHWKSRISPLQFEFPFDTNGVAPTRMADTNSGLFAEQPTAAIEHVYDGFWRPDGHIGEIEQQVLHEQRRIAVQGDQKSNANDSVDIPEGTLH